MEFRKVTVHTICSPSCTLPEESIGCASGKGIGEVDPGLLPQIFCIGADLGCSIHRCVFGELIGNRFHILIERHQRNHVDRKHQNKGNDHNSNGNINVALAVFSFLYFPLVIRPPWEEISTCPMTAT